MRKVNWKALLSSTILISVISILLLGQYISTFDHLAVIKPDLTSSFFDGGRLFVAIDAFSTVDSLVDIRSFFLLVGMLVLVNNIFIALFASKDLPIEVSKEEDTMSFKRLHSYLSHEQKNNLAIIRMRMELQGDTETLAYIDKISHSMDDVLTLSDDVSEEDLEDVDLILLVAEVCDDYKSLVDLDFTFQVDRAVIRSKYQWIYRAISNLIDNAIKFGNDKPIEVSVGCEYSSVIVCVSDQGIGIEESQLDAIFKHEYRVNPLKSDGYGIGLSLVNRVCDLSGGSIWVDSQEGTGTSFYLSFPQV